MKAPSTNIQAPEKIQGSNSKPARAVVGMPRCGVTARAVAGGTSDPTAHFSRNVAPLNAARTAQARHPYQPDARSFACLEVGSSLELGAWDLELLTLRGFANRGH